ncbi:hypothetical protein TNCV_5136121 [Trichonephila clavipes]|nr:hypothetical protein TNCV_5136121 [Trichonephila clavipes]
MFRVELDDFQDHKASSERTRFQSTKDITQNAMDPLRAIIKKDVLVLLPTLVESFVVVYDSLKRLEWKDYLSKDLKEYCNKDLRIKWAGHMARMNEDRCCKKIFLAKHIGNRPRADNPLGWIDCVEKDLNILKVKNWKTVSKSRDAWRRLGLT